MDSRIKILAIGDSQAPFDIYRDILGKDGFSIDTAVTRDETLAMLELCAWTVVLVELHFGFDPIEARDMEVIEQIERRTPGAKVILVTGCIGPKGIDAAFANGIYDFVEKTENFETLLRAKVRNATELARSRLG